MGEHRDLLAYLVRRLLENGANSSFVHQLADPSVQVPELLGSPLADVRTTSALPLPPALYLDENGRGRANSTGADLTAPAQRAPLLSALEATPVHTVPEATAAEVDAAMQRLHAGFPAWNATPVTRRVAILRRAADDLDARLAEFLSLIHICPALRDSNPVVVLLPRIGMVTIAADKATARIAGEFYINAINVMREANAVDKYVGLPEQEAFDIEYWLLEEAKLQRMPKPKPLVGKVALVTGGAGGIGQAIARRMLTDGACVVLLDIDQAALDEAVATMCKQFGKDVVRGVRCDVTSEESVQQAFACAAREFGGADILVSNAGIASAAPLEDTSLELWKRNQDILATGYFLVGREAFRQMKAQGTGGSIIVVASKNGMVASNQATAYCAAKAAEIQLSRSFALEGAPLGIRSNVVNPDAVIRGSKIWTGKWSEERAAANKIEEGDLESFYRDRSMLKRSVYPEDIAEAAFFFAAEHLSAKCTGNIVNVDAGNLAAFTR